MSVARKVTTSKKADSRKTIFKIWARPAPTASRIPISLRRWGTR
jgi:hypothetical protein